MKFVYFSALDKKEMEIASFHDPDQFNKFLEVKVGLCSKDSDLYVLTIGRAMAMDGSSSSTGTTGPSCSCIWAALKDIIVNFRKKAKSRKQTQKSLEHKETKRSENSFSQNIF